MIPKSDPSASEAGVLPQGRIEGRIRFAQVLRQALETAARDGWPSLWLADPDFLEWPLGERAVIASLDAWAGRGRQVFFLANDFSALRRAHPRLVDWRTRWGHIVEARACPPGRGIEIPSGLLSASWVIERIDIPRAVSLASVEPRRRIALQERWDHCWAQAHPSFAATTLGL